MVFVTLGTQDKTFERLIEAVENQVKKQNIKEEVIVQAGSTKYVSDFVKIIPYMNENEFHDYMKKADIIITHGGVGTIIEGLELKKKMIVVPRLAKYGEHVNDHQVQIVENFEKSGYILAVYDLEKLDLVLAKLKEFIPKEYKKNNDKFVNKLEEEIQNLLVLKN